MASCTEDYTVYDALWALTEISVGSQEGNGRSNATYNYVRIQEVPVTVTASESFTDDLTVTEPSTKTKTSENKKLDINTYSDNTYGVTFYGVEGETANLGDLTIKVLALFVCAALQTTPGLFQLGQAKPLLVLPLCLAVAVFEGDSPGRCWARWAAFCGTTPPGARWVCWRWNCCCSALGYRCWCSCICR